MHVPLLLIASLFWWSQAANAAESPSCAAGSTLSVAQGQLCGATSPGSDQIFVYKGLPFAKPPVPEAGLRWMPPQPPEGWDGLRQALKFGAICPQQMGADIYGAEDCLTLNVWTPRAAVGKKPSLPVMVFLFGGGFTSGAGSLASYDGTQLAEQGQAVVVTLNYRLGALGFLYAEKSPAGKLARPIPGNLGLMDQLAALEWVKANIGAFGGDAAKVTLFGESAGAMSIGLHLFSVPRAIPLFRAAIMESNPLGVLYPRRARAAAYGSQYIGHLCGATVRPADCAPSFADMQAYSLNQVFQASTAYEVERMTKEADAGFPQSMPWGPLIDGTLVTGQPLDGYGPENLAAAKPFVFGFNADEGVAFAAMTCADFASNAGTPNPNPEQAAQCLPVGATASMMNPAWYDAAIAQLFGKAGAARVRAFTDSQGLKPYDSSALPGTSYYNAAAQAMAAVVGDDNFVCANLHGAERALRQAPQQKVYGYVFSQPPLFNLYAGMGTNACIPANGQVCHGDELAFVFDTLTVTSAEFQGILPVPAADKSLSRRMVQAWTRFARDLSMAEEWKPLASGGFMRLHSGAPGMVKTSDVAAAANCPQLWDKVKTRFR